MVVRINFFIVLQRTDNIASNNKEAKFLSTYFFGPAIP
jgi:hypothetical protein